MEEGQGVEEHDEARGQDIDEFNPASGENLPTDVIDYIADEVLITLPFSRVRSFCSVCRRWRDVLLSMEYILYFHNSHECMIFNPRTGSWESMPLLFSQAEARNLQHMELVSCAGGLLYFANCVVRDELIAYNPLTGRWRPLREPNEARQIRDDAELETRLTCPSGWLLYRDVRDSLPFGRSQNIVVKILAPSDTEDVEVLVVKHYPYGAPSVTLTVIVSRRDWIRVLDVDIDFCFVVMPTLVRSEGSVMLGLYACTGGFNVLYYNVVEHRCHWVLDIPSLHLDVGANQRTLFANVTSGSQWKFLELRDGGLTLGRAPFPQDGGPTLGWARFSPLDIPPTRGFSQTLNFVQLEHEDIVYEICLFREFPRGQLNISVSTRNLVNGLERVSDWMECRPSTWESHNLPSSRNFFVFKPSFLRP